MKEKKGNLYLKCFCKVSVQLSRLFKCEWFCLSLSAVLRFSLSFHPSWGLNIINIIHKLLFCSFLGLLPPCCRFIYGTAVWTNCFSRWADAELWSSVTVSVFVCLPNCLRGGCLSVSLTVRPNLQQFFSKDVLYMSCDQGGQRIRRTTGGQTEPWTAQRQTGLSPSDSGLYWCETSDGRTSESVNITVVPPGTHAVSAVAFDMNQFSLLRVFSSVLLFKVLVNKDKDLKPSQFLKWHLVIGVITTCVLWVILSRPSLDCPLILEIPALPVMTGGTVTFLCRTKDGSRTAAFFFRNSTDIGGRTVHQQVTLGHIQPSDEGFYSCSTNLLGSSLKSWLRVQGQWHQSFMFGICATVSKSCFWKSSRMWFKAFYSLNIVANWD